MTTPQHARPGPQRTRADTIENGRLIIQEASVAFAAYLKLTDPARAAFHAMLRAQRLGRDPELNPYSVGIMSATMMTRILADAAAARAESADEDAGDQTLPAMAEG